MNVGAIAGVCSAPSSNAAQAGTGGNIRLDPYRLPHRISISNPSNSVSGDTSFRLDRHGAVVKCRLAGGFDLSLALPTRAFAGIAASATDSEFGARVCLKLHHRDPALCIPLLDSDDLDDIAADWHAWSRIMRLPMLVSEQCGDLTHLQQMLGEIMVSNPMQRRRRVTCVKHRPWFLRRRKSGIVGPLTRIQAHEIIARN